MRVCVDVLDIHEQEVGHLHERLELAEKRLPARKGLPGRIDAGVHAARLCLPEEIQQEIHLQQGLAAAHCDAPLVSPIRPIALRLVQQLICCPQFTAPLPVPRIHVMAVQAAHRTALQEDDEARLWSIHGAKRFDGMNASLNHDISSQKRPRKKSVSSRSSYKVLLKISLTKIKDVPKSGWPGLNRSPAP